MPTAQSISLRATGWTAGVPFPAEQDFSPLHVVQVGSVAHPASYPNGTVGCFPGGKAAGVETHHSPPSRTEVKNSGAINLLPPVSLWHSA
jgi:hypothetical protein